MNTYIVPMSTVDDIWIEKITAKSLSEAKDKVIDNYVNLWDITVPGDWSEFVKTLEDIDVLVGDIIDIDVL